MNDYLLAQVTDLPKMGIEELKICWQKLFKEAPPPRSHKNALIKKLAYRLQELAYGISPDIDIRLAQHADNYFGKGGKQKAKKAYQLPMIGTKLVRHYQGIAYQVTILEKGFEFENCLYTSLSKIAKKITGTAWSGPTFFGITQKREHKK